MAPTNFGMFFVNKQAPTPCQHKHSHGYLRSKALDGRVLLLDETVLEPFWVQCSFHRPMKNNCASKFVQLLQTAPQLWGIGDCSCEFVYMTDLVPNCDSVGSKCTRTI